MSKVADKVYGLIEPAISSLGYILWDVRFVKEGASYYLRVYIDKDGEISIDDCVKVSHTIDPIIDEADPVDKQYYLEVCSPGLERELTREWHYDSAVGQKVKVKLFSAEDGKKEFCGTLLSGGEEIRIAAAEGEKVINRSKIAKAFIEYQD